LALGASCSCRKYKRSTTIIVGTHTITANIDDEMGSIGVKNGV